MEKFLFLDIDTEELVTSDGLHITPPKGKEQLTHLADALDEDDVQAWTGFQNLVPALGFQKWDGHIYVSGATGAGKSFMINMMLMHDNRKRKVFLFTDHKRVDPSLKPMIKVGRMFIVREKPDSRKRWEVPISRFIRDKKGSIIMFDDATHPDVLFMRDNALRKGRHSDSMVICVNHKLRDHGVTKHALTNARFMITFPSANRGGVMNFMKDTLEMQPRARRAVLKLAVEDGRPLTFHLQSPNVLATAKSIIRI